MRGKEFIEHDNPYDVGMTGLLGFSSGYRAMMACDALLMLGTDFPYPQFFPAEAKVMQVDCGASRSAGGRGSTLASSGDVGETIRALSPVARRESGRRPPGRRLDHYQQGPPGARRPGDRRAGQKPIHPQYVAKLLDEVAADDAIFTCDVGTPTVWAARYLR